MLGARARKIRVFMRPVTGSVCGAARSYEFTRPVNADMAEG